MAVQRRAVPQHQVVFEREREPHTKFVRIRVHDPQAALVLQQVVGEQTAMMDHDYALVSGSGDLCQAADGWWCTVLAWVQVAPLTPRCFLPWSSHDVERLRQ